MNDTYADIVMNYLTLRLMASLGNMAVYYISLERKSAEL